MNNILTISPSPHIHSGDSVKKNMRDVIIALLPAYAVALYSFGLGAFIVSLTAIFSCLLFEFLIQKFILKGDCTLGNMSALVTGMLLAFNLPSNLPWWIIVIGALVAIGIGKMTFGGLGNNPFNPALVGRVFLLISFPAQMTTWPRPVPMNLDFNYFDAETGATTLSMLKGGFGKIPTLTQMLFGEMGGSVQADAKDIPDITENDSPELKRIVYKCLSFHPWDRPIADDIMKYSYSFL